jgi:hypothetical protein
MVPWVTTERKKKTSITLVFVGNNIIVTGRGTINCTDTPIFGILAGILYIMNAHCPAFSLTNEAG